MKRRLLTIDGPEFSNEEHGSEGLCSSKVSKKSSNGLHISITSDQRPLHGVTKTWSRCRSRALICSNAGYIHIKVDQWLLRRSCRGKYLSCSTTHSTGCTYKSGGIVVGSVQTVAAIANDESLQVRVQKAHPPRREVISAPFGTQRCQNGVSPNFVKCCVIAKIVLLRARPV